MTVQSKNVGFTHKQAHKIEYSSTAVDWKNSKIIIAMHMYAELNAHTKNILFALLNMHNLTAGIFN